VTTISAVHFVEIKFTIFNFSQTGITIADTTKPESPQISTTHTIVEKTTIGPAGLFDGTRFIWIKKTTYKITFSATNSDTVDHTLYYEIYLAGSLAKSGSFVVTAGGSETSVEVASLAPSGNTVSIEIYMWADAANVITVDVSIDGGVGTETTTDDEIIRVQLGGDMTIYASFSATGTATYTWTLQAVLSNTRIAYYTNDDLVFVAPAPPLKLLLRTDTSGEIAICKSIIVISKNW